MNKEFLIESLKKIKTSGSHTEIGVIVDSVLLYLNTAKEPEPAPPGFSVRFVHLGSQKLNAIKEVRGVTSWGLKESKDFVEGNGGIMLKDIPYNQAVAIKRVFDTQTDSKVEIIPQTQLGKVLYE